MSRHNPTKAKEPARVPARQPTKAGSVGAREIERRARALNRHAQAARRRTRRIGKGGPAARLVLDARAALGRVPRAAWICAAVACLNAACWSIVTPPFQVPDEPSHFAYTQQLVENGRLPTSNGETFSPEENVVLRDLHQYEVHGSPESHTIATAAAQRRLQEDLARHPSRQGEGGVGGAYSGPPLYYLLEAVPYGLASAGTLLDQLQLMRLLSAVMAAVTTLLVFLFLRETLPGSRWTWTVGGLGVALTPLLGFMGGAVNPDSMLAAVSAAIFYCFARAFRGGVTLRRLIAIGTLAALGFLTKLNFIGLAPGVVLGMALLTVQGARTYGRAAFRWFGVALAIAASPACLYVLVHLLSGHRGLGIVSDNLNLRHGSVLARLSYVWQLYLPRLPGMTNYFPGLFTTRHLWFDRSVGFYGWLDTSFPVWVDNLALVPAGLIAALCVRGLIAARAALRRCRTELLVYAVMGVGLLALVGAGSYANTETEGLGFAEPRYLLPLLSLLAVLLALAARGAGRRWGPAVGAVMVVLFLAHDIFSQLLVASRFYA
jgi:Predicted membrane protein (DUF2142)